MLAVRIMVKQLLSKENVNFHVAQRATLWSTCLYGVYCVVGNIYEMNSLRERFLMARKSSAVTSCDSEREAQVHALPYFINYNWLAVKI